MTTNYATLAGFWPRVAAKLLDGLIFAPISAGNFWAMTQPAHVYVMLYLPLAILGLGISVFFIGRWGATPGKMIMKLKIIDIGGGAVSYMQAVIRDIVNIVLTLIMFTAFALKYSDIEADATGLILIHAADKSPLFMICSLVGPVWLVIDSLFVAFTKQRRAVHDFIAKTAVIHVRKEPVQS